MVTLKAVRNFNYGGKYRYKGGEIFQAEDIDAIALVKFKFAEKEDTSHKKMNKK